MRSDVLFVSVILQILVVIGGWVGVKFHERWFAKEVARERLTQSQR